MTNRVGSSRIAKRTQNRLRIRKSLMTFRVDFYFLIDAQVFDKQLETTLATSSDITFNLIFVSVWYCDVLVVSQYQSLPTWSLPPFWYTWIFKLTEGNLKRPIPTSCRSLYWKLFLLLIRSIPGGPLLELITITHSSGFHGRCRLFLMECIYLDPTQRRQYFCPDLPISIQRIHGPLVLSYKCQQVSKYDTISLRLPDRFNSSRWSPRSWSLPSTTSLSEHCWLHKLACNLQSSWHCAHYKISRLIQQLSPPTTL